MPNGENPQFGRRRGSFLTMETGGQNRQGTAEKAE
jgi:hypothetical protein